MRIRRHVCAAVLAAAALGSACGGGGSSPGSPSGPTSPTSPASPTPPARTVASVVVSARETLVVFGSVQLKAEAVYSDGSKADVTASATWVSESTDLATVNATGLAQGKATGKVTFKATYQSVTGSLEVTVRGRRVNFDLNGLRIESLGSCEGLLEGPGDFVWEASAEGTTIDADIPLAWSIDRTFAYPDRGFAVELNPGQSARIGDGKTTRRIHNESGSFVTIQFRATEWDYALVSGAPFKDERMTDAKVTHTYRWTAGGGWGDAFGLHSVTVGSGSCRLRFHFEIAISTID